MTSTTTSTTRRRKGTRAQRSPANREATDAARAARIAALHEQIGAQVERLTADPQWRAMLDTAARFHRYSLGNQLLIMAQAADRGFTPTRVAGFGTWKALGRSVIKGQRGLAVLAPCTYRAGSDHDQGAEERAGETAAEGSCGGPADREDGTPGRRVLRGFRVVHVFDVSQTDGQPLPEIRPELLTGDAPAALWAALTDQVAAHGYTVTRADCGPANGITDPATRTVRVRPDVDGAQAVKTLAHELAHIECGHTAHGFDYLGCRGQAEAEAESVAYIVTAWAGLNSGPYTVPYVAGWCGGDTAVLRAAAASVTAAAGRILASLEGDDDGGDPEPAGPASQPAPDTAGVLLVAA
ncbi:ArdC-like ssDNA-binding domain-containing protein [Geodermatophilus sp. DSM 44513]|uniref:ArdC-like ssDNA-binding domain-containing protein n=1 Tax=Geodermatophilus sp. DSM 44513 TaxID=1528104 RepID=UPI0012898302|nr:ArdC-like ssDNA-binding domain-containing protein [Geodermatophilus sp. DSM 44513]WNV75264.1 ArdC-like ssDNA-binding domain-containing protein [Geodermatophilus sp. DSM 44513]